jgi:flagellar biosynthesis/type III secretory pathway protein FliH
MKSQLNEVQKLQKIAGILKESQLNEAPELLDIMKDYISNVYTLDQGFGDDEDELNAEQESIKSQIIKAKGEDYFEILNDFAEDALSNNEYAGPEESPAIEARMQELADQLGFTVDQLIY